MPSRTGNDGRIETLIEYIQKFRDQLQSCNRAFWKEQASCFKWFNRQTVRAQLLPLYEAGKQENIEKIVHLFGRLRDLDGKRSCFQEKNINIDHPFGVLHEEIPRRPRCLVYCLHQHRMLVSWWNGEVPVGREVPKICSLQLWFYKGQHYSWNTYSPVFNFFGGMVQIFGGVGEWIIGNTYSCALSLHMVCAMPIPSIWVGTSVWFCRHISHSVGGIIHAFFRYRDLFFVDGRFPRRLRKPHV